MDTHGKTPLQRVKQRIREEKDAAPRVDISEYKETAKILRKYKKLLNMKETRNVAFSRFNKCIYLVLSHLQLDKFSLKF